MLQDSPTPISASARPYGASVVIETERLTLRRPTAADVHAIALLANDSRIAQMTRRLPHPYLPEHAASFVDAVARNDREQAYLIEHLNTPVGMIGIDRTNATSPELGYWLGCAYWGRGFATEAARAAVDAAFEVAGVAEIVASARVINPASRNILEKCGFRWTGVELHRVESIGASTPVDRFRLSRDVWLSLKNWGTATEREG